MVVAKQYFLIHTHKVDGIVKFMSHIISQDGCAIAKSDRGINILAERKRAADRHKEKERMKIRQDKTHRQYIWPKYVSLIIVMILIIIIGIVRTHKLSLHRDHHLRALYSNVLIRDTVRERERE